MQTSLSGSQITNNKPFCYIGLHIQQHQEPSRAVQHYLLTQLDHQLGLHHLILVSSMLQQLDHQQLSHAHRPINNNLLHNSSSSSSSKVTHHHRDLHPQILTNHNNSNNNRNHNNSNKGVNNHHQPTLFLQE